MKASQLDNAKKHLENAMEVAKIYFPTEAHFLIVNKKLHA